LLELTASEVEQMEARLYRPMPAITPDDALRLINDWRKQRWAINHLFKLFRPSEDGKFYFVDQMRSDTFLKLKTSVGLA
jgi:hypothetical protein